MKTYYTNEQNTQMLIYLLKEHKIHRIVVSPGATNICFVASIQQDPYFTVYSCVDERSAAYIACGLAAESMEPVALSCTGATASRNYLSGLTEAFYRRLPVLAITSTQYTGRIGHQIPQVIDRTIQLNDTFQCSVQIPMIDNEEDRWSNNVLINKALLALRHRGGGPVHINLTTSYSKDYSCQILPETRVIRRICNKDSFPEIKGKHIAIFCGAHLRWDSDLTKAVDKFCKNNNAVVLCDHTSNYKGEYGILANIITDQAYYTPECVSIDLLIHIGDVSGSYMNIYPHNVWRIHPDGALCDTFRKLTYVFEMDEIDFFTHYARQSRNTLNETSYIDEWKKEREYLLTKIKDIPFSNAWIAEQTSKRLPENSVLHLGILNSLRTWNFFDTKLSVSCFCNTGGFGIDGCISTLLGASLVHQDRLYFGVVGDLAFFYDMNVLGNRHFGPNVRLLVVNNGCGTEFKNYNHNAAQFGENADPYIAAAGHYGFKTSHVIKAFSESLGFTYFCASSKEEYLNVVENFISPVCQKKPMVLEVFTDSKLESDALRYLYTLENPYEDSTVFKVKQATKSFLKSIINKEFT